MPQSYEREFQKKIVRLHLEEGRTYKSITQEYGVSKASISKWCREFSEECQTQAKISPDTATQLDIMKKLISFVQMYNEKGTISFQRWFLFHLAELILLVYLHPVSRYAEQP